MARTHVVGPKTKKIQFQTARRMTSGTQSRLAKAFALFQLPFFDR
jgi:hypothetical protein